MNSKLNLELGVDIIKCKYPNLSMYVMYIVEIKKNPIENWSSENGKNL